MSFTSKNINGYTVLRLLGSGGMGEVYYAHHQDLQREAAVKVLYQKDMLDRFKNEAYIQASVKHPGIATLYEFSKLGEQPCIIMEYVNGLTLEQYVLKHAVLSERKIGELFKQIIDAIAYLHEKGIQHRDIKPSNIKVTPEGIIKLLDFGIAKSKYTPRLTKEGYIVGTTEFMAPEQFRGQQTLAGDVWSLGVLLYFLCTRQLPFSNDSFLIQRQNIEKGSYTQPEVFNPGISSSYKKLISRMLQVKPEKRLTIQEVKSVLADKTIAHSETQALVAWFTGNKNSFAWGLGVLSLLLVFLFLFKVNSGSEKREKGELTLPVEIVVQNSNRASILLQDKRVLTRQPFVVEKPVGEPYEFTILEGKYEKRVVIDAGFNSERFMCTMDY